MNTLRGLGALVALPLSCFPAAASRSGPEPVHVRTYASSSGRYQLEVDPTERYGCGRSNCTLMHNGRIVWSRKLPFTFFEAAVAEDGTAAGYGYTQGMDGLNFRSPTSGPGELRAAILDVRGKQRLDTRIPRHPSSFVDGGPEPVAGGILLHDDRFTLRIGGAESEEWRGYQLPTGKKAKPMEMKPPASAGRARCLIQEAAVITGTPLTLVHWYRHDSETDKTGAIFTVVEHHGTPVWELAKPENFTLPDEGASERLQEAVRKDGAIFRTTEAGKFELWFAAEGQRVVFSIEKTGEDWRVVEVSRRAHTPAGPAKPAPPPPEAPEPEKLGGFVLEATPVTGAVRDIETFAFDQSGRIGFLRDHRHFVLIDQGGTLLAEVPLSLPDPSRAALTWIAGGRWLATSSEAGEKSKARAWWIDAAQRSLAEIAGFDCPPITALSGAGEGGFVVVASERRKYSVTDEVSAYDSDGARRWRREADSGREAGTFLSPESLTVTTRGEVAVLDKIRNTIVLFALSGAHLRTADLQKTWKREPHYPSEITADANGGVVVTDFDGKPPFIRMNADGTVRAGLVPKFGDGKLTRQDAELRVAPDGVMWLNHTHALLRLDDQGLVTKIIGRAPAEDSLGVISAATADMQGNIYVADDQTGAVHVFDATGGRIRVCHLRSADIPGNLGNAHLAVTDRGSVLLCCGGIEPRCIGFGPDGKRVGAAPALDTGEAWFSRRAAGGMLRLGFESVTLTDGKYAPQRVIERRPDRRWLDFAIGAAVAPDGSFAILERGRPEGDTVSFYSPVGDPLRSVRQPSEHWEKLDGWNGTHFVASRGSTSAVCDRDGKVLLRFGVPATEGGWAQFLTRGGRELWVLEFATRQVTRWSMPQR